jgi:AraC-like DNA-binding protein
LLDLIEQIQSGTPDPYTGKSILTLLVALLTILVGKIVTTGAGTKTKESRGTFLTNSFTQLLKQHYKTWKQPARYATELSISVAHLNDTVKGITGTSVSAHIQQYSVLEAKRLLYFTDLSVKEIGYALGYDEPVYFGKLFKK